MTSEKENLDQRHREEHESFGIISFTRGNGANMALFGSSILHQHIIRMEIRSAYKDRHLHQDWIHGHKVLLKAYMSPAQFAEAFGSMGQGGGTPITLQYVAGDDHPREWPAAPNKTNEFTREREEAVAESIQQVNRILEQKQCKGALRRAVEGLKHTLTSNLSFLQDSHREQMEQTVVEAKAEVEAFVTARMHVGDGPALAETVVEMPSLPHAYICSLCYDMGCVACETEGGK